jgi:hypothetical protein
VTALDLEVSYDDGASWRPVPVLRCDDLAIALLVHPRQASTVSLRSRAADADGNTVQQTVIESYRTR